MNEDDDTANGDTATEEEEKRVAAAATTEASRVRVQIHPTIRPLIIVIIFDGSAGRWRLR